MHHSAGSRWRLLTETGWETPLPSGGAHTLGDDAVQGSAAPRNPAQRANQDPKQVLCRSISDRRRSLEAPSQAHAPQGSGLGRGIISSGPGKGELMLNPPLAALRTLKAPGAQAQQAPANDFVHCTHRRLR